MLWQPVVLQNWQQLLHEWLGSLLIPRFCHQLIKSGYNDESNCKSWKVLFPTTLRQRNTRYKNAQLVAQHCFVASFLRCFPFFSWRDQLDLQQKHLLRVEEMQHADWLVFQVASKSVARQVVSLMKNEQQRQNLLLKVYPCSTFLNNFLQPATNVFVAGQVDRARWKTGNIDKNLQRSNVARQVERFFISCFAALSRSRQKEAWHLDILFY